MMDEESMLPSLPFVVNIAPSAQREKVAYRFRHLHGGRGIVPQKSAPQGYFLRGAPAARLYLPGLRKIAHQEASPHDLTSFDRVIPLFDCPVRADTVLLVTVAKAVDGTCAADCSRWRCGLGAAGGNNTEGRHEISESRFNRCCNFLVGVICRMRMQIPPHP
jgi:hypothetical protein